MTPAATTANGSDSATTDEQEDEDEPFWAVTAEEYRLAKESYSQYTLRAGPITIEFEKVRDQDDGTYRLLREGVNKEAYFDPTDNRVPNEIETAFTILVNEL